MLTPNVGVQEMHKYLNKRLSVTGLAVCILLIISASALCGCLQSQGEPKYNLTAEDSAYLEASENLPMGSWNAASDAEVQEDYQKMYRIAEEQKELYEIRIQKLSSMPVSDTFQEIKDEYQMADEYGLKACEYEMKRAKALMESDPTAEEQYWEIEDDAMDESLKHMALAKKLRIERYGL